MGLPMTESRSHNKSRAAYLDNRQLALRIQGEGFEVVKAEIGERLDAIRACRIVAVLKEHGYRDIDSALLELAAQKRHGHVGGPVTPPDEGETRVYIVGVNGRVGLPLGILGKKPGERAKVKFSKTGIRVLPS